MAARGGDSSGGGAKPQAAVGAKLGGLDASVLAAPVRHPLLLGVATIALAGWLAFLGWMAFGAG